MADFKSPFIVVETTGPIEDDDVLYLHEGTFGNLVSVIQDEIDDQQDEYRKQIQNCIFSAIRFCERETFYFNENRDTMFLTEAGRRIYTGQDNEHISTSVQINRAFINDSYGTIELVHKNHIDMELVMKSPDIGRPTSYTYFNKQLYLYPTPDTEYEIRLVLSPMRFHEIQNIKEPHPWFSDGFDLIKSRAEYELFKNILREPDRAEAALADFNEHLQAIRYETSKRKNASKLYITEF